MKYKIILIVLALIVGFPTVALGGSFTVSLIQGKTPAEAVQIIAEQMDSLFGRVESLETQQIQTNESIDATQLEIERLKLENENLRLEAAKTTRQVGENETAIKTVPACEKLYKTLTCARGAVATYSAMTNAPVISSSASLEEVVLALNTNSGYVSGGPYHAKAGTDTICFTGSDNKEQACRERTEYISGINADREERRKQANKYLPEQNTQIQTSQSEFEKLQCEAVLQKYSPNLSPPGCG